MNSVCYYFSFPDNVGLKTWQKARDFCQTYGGDLVVIDSQDKEVCPRLSLTLSGVRL